MKKSKIIRKHPVHLPVMEMCNRSNIIFVTVCTHNRKPLLASDDMHRLINDAWRSADQWVVGRYVIMPDHIHLFCSPAGLNYCALEVWVKYWKSIVSRNRPSLVSLPLWQRHFWDRQLRRGDSYGEKWNYVRENPVRAGLVDSADQWTYEGEQHCLMWHD